MGKKQVQGVVSVKLVAFKIVIIVKLIEKYSGRGRGFSLIVDMHCDQPIVIRKDCDWVSC